jgi:chemotaxis signal transduction protein
MIGWINVRGDLIPVIDLRRRLGLKVRDENPNDVFVLVTNGRDNLAILAEEVIGVSKAEPGEDGHSQANAKNDSGAEISISKSGESLLSIALSSLGTDAILPIAR